MKPGCCQLCGTTDPKKHWWSCPKSPDMLEVRPKAEQIVARFMRRRAKWVAKHRERVMRIGPNAPKPPTPGLWPKLGPLTIKRRVPK